jgi:peptidyl-prolyl cis-trans isomerase A (cyclophilin A)
MRPAALWTLVALVSLGLLACRAPRDPDLDERMAHHRAKASSAEAKKADLASKPAPEPRKRRPEDPPPKGQVELRVYSEAEIKTLLSGLSGQGANIQVGIETPKGTIKCLLDVEGAPQTVINFVALATGKRPWRDPDTGDVARGRFYDGLTFHRTISNFIIQTGNPSATGAAGPGWTIQREAGEETAFDGPGVLTMVDAGEESHGSQFFITARAAKNFHGKYAPFGTCDNPDLVKDIAKAEKHPPAAEGKSATKPKRPTRIERVSIRRVAAP